MNDKTAGKNKGKAKSVQVLTIGDQQGGLKPVLSVKRGKQYSFVPKAPAVHGKQKAAYTSYSPSAIQIHDAGIGAEFAAAPPTGLETTPLEDETGLADQLVSEVARDSADVRALCETYKLKREELGRLTGFSLRALAEWAAGKLPSQPARRRLQEVRRLLDALAQIVKPESIPQWLHQRNPAFDRLSPLQIIELGEIDRLWAMVHDLASGQPD